MAATEPIESSRRPLLGVDVTSEQWQLVRRYVEERAADLAAQALSPACDDTRRRDLVNRRDELLALLRAPTDTVRRVSMHTDKPRSTY